MAAPGDGIADVSTERHMVNAQDDSRQFVGRRPFEFTSISPGIFRVETFSSCTAGTVTSFNESSKRFRSAAT
eukprot:927291-Rhodomonas_salina.1